MLPKSVSDSLEGDDLINDLINENAEFVKMRTGSDSQAENASVLSQAVVRDFTVTQLLRRSMPNVSRDAAEGIDRWERRTADRLNQLDISETTDTESGGLSGGEGEGAGGAGEGWSDYYNPIDDAFEQEPLTPGDRMLFGLDERDQP